MRTIIFAIIFILSCSSGYNGRNNLILILKNNNRSIEYLDVKVFLDGSQVVDEVLKSNLSTRYKGESYKFSINNNDSVEMKIVLEELNLSKTETFALNEKTVIFISFPFDKEYLTQNENGIEISIMSKKEAKKLGY